MECDSGDNLVAEISTDEAIRTIYVEVACGSGFDNDICNNTDFCRASDTTAVYGTGSCSGWTDEPWSSGYYRAQLTCGSGGSGGDSTLTQKFDAALAMLTQFDPGDAQVCVELDNLNLIDVDEGYYRLVSYALTVDMLADQIVQLKRLETVSRLQSKTWPRR